MSKQPTKPTLQKIQPDKDEDLDDLDDVLDKFSPANTAPSAPPPTALPTSSATSLPFGNRPRHNTRVDAPPISTPGIGPKLNSTTEVDEAALSEEFARELSKEMENLMKELVTEDTAGSSSNVTAGSNTDGTANMTDEERAKAFKAAWEAMLVEELDGRDGDETKDVNTSTNNFQSQIKQAMDKLKESETNLQSSSTAPGTDAESESIEKLLKSFGDLGLENGADDTELAGFLENMMGQLLSKDVLYEPLKELADNFPGYLANPPNPLEPADKTRYEKQYSYVKQIIEVFEKPDYSDSDAEASKKVMTLMNEMQSEGSPPPEIMGPLPPGFENGMPALGDEGCVVA